MNDSLLQRASDETDYQYHKRLIHGKLIDKTLADYDYSELSPYIYGKKYSSDVARRLMYGSRMTLDLVEKEGLSKIEDNDVLNELELKRIELQKERRRFFDQRREFNKLITAKARNEYLESCLIESASNLNESIGRLFTEERHDFNCNDNEALLVFSDWHYGMETDNIYNTFNTEICKKRIKATVDNAIDRICLHKCKRLHIMFLGDVINGSIHTSTRVASEELVIDQLMHISEIAAQSIAFLSGFVPETVVYVTFGNHGRVIPNKSDNIHSDNIERVMGWWLSERFRDADNISIVDGGSSEFIVFDICGHSICGVHGDIDNIVSSPKILATLFQKKYGIDIEYIILGDKHHRESIEELGITSMICGALCGADNYASDKRLFSTPSQLLLIFDKYGLDAEYRLRCQ